MANKINRRRRVRLDQFKKQLAEEVIGDESLIEVEYADGQYITLYIPIDPEESREHTKRLRESGNDLETGALEILGHNPDVDAKTQLDKWLAAGNTIGDLMLVYKTESALVGDRLGEFRYRG